MLRLRSRPLLAAASTLTMIVALAACLPPDGDHAVRLRFEDAPPAGQSAATFITTGNADVVIDVAFRNSGIVTGGPGQSGGAADRAARFPTHDASPEAPRAVVRIVEDGPGDALDPGTQRFSFGVDVNLDAVSSSNEPGSSDNGDNVFQRGLYNDASQYKLQVDGRRPSCRVSGSAGAVFVRSPVSLQAGQWYRMTCTRDGDTVTLAVSDLNAGTVGTTTSTSGTGATGSMTPSSSQVPLSVGGKLNADGSVASSTDQFNGTVDTVRLLIG